VTTAAAPVGSQSVAAVAAPDETTMTGRTKRKMTSSAASATALVIAVLWTIPTAGLFISSFRPAEQIRTSGWWNFFVNPSFTLQNYDEVLFSQSAGAGQLAGYFINSIVITIPTVLFALALAAFAAYALAWIPFRGATWVFIGSSPCRSCRCRWRSCRCCACSPRASAWETSP
jgi:alpha-glucoside transport system permease protein